MQPEIRNYSRSRGLHIKGLAVLLAFTVLLCAAAAASSAGWNRSQDVFMKAVPAADQPFRFMTYNIRHAKGLDSRVRLSAIREQIELGEADFIALQEVDRYQWRSGLQDQAASLAKALRMHYGFAPAVRRGLSEYGLALLSRYPLERVRVYPLPGGGAGEPRAVLTAQFRLGGQPVTVATTHLGVARSEREQQIPALLAVLQSIDTPLIVAGDFNMADSDPLMTGLHQWLHKVPLNRPQSTIKEGGEIDHIFTGFAPASPAWIQPSSASDHLPVFCQIRLLN